MRLKKRTEIKKPDVVYNLHIEDNHNYFANGVLAKNCHGATGDVQKKLFTDKLAGVPIRWGMTGTIPKDAIKKVEIEISLGPVVLEVHTKELQDKGFLAKCEIDVIQLEEKREFIDYRAEFDDNVFDDEKLDYWANMLEQISTSGNTLVLLTRVKTGKLLLEKLQNRGLDVEFVYGGVKAKDRKKRYREVNDSKNTITLAIDKVAATGIDIPNLHNVVLFELGKSFTTVMQSLGRGVRIGSDKNFLQLFDFCYTAKYSNRHKNERCKYYREKEQPHTVHKIKDWRQYV